MWSSRRRINVLFGALIMGAFVACTSGQPGKPLNEQTCDSCEFLQFDLLDAIPTDTLVYRKAMAIGYFPIGQNPEDTLAEIDRQQWYRYMDQFNYYEAMLKPVITSWGVTVVDTIPRNTILFFDDGRNEYIIDVSPLHKRDGVVMWTPGKAPVIWPPQHWDNACGDTTYLSCYFRK